MLAPFSFACWNGGKGLASVSHLGQAGVLVATNLPACSLEESVSACKVELKGGLLM